ncbi:polyhydroxyalkanoic acid system family protein [Vibrio alfacsensis]|jgi:putative polyhydroxyalkanoate system protein|uniref:polyhydroxyalkanoic acid system family protein n=1 Tax=Vibrio TaxID=662 RepID=UPI0040691602
MVIFIERNHELSHIQARNVAEQVANELEQEFGLLWHWDEEHLHFQHHSARGWLLATSGKLSLNIRLGFAASLFAYSIEQHISLRLDELLG